MSVRCFCECHTYPGVYPPPCGVCGHDTREGRMVGGYRDGWEPNEPKRMTRQEWQTLKFADFDRLEADLLESKKREQTLSEIVEKRDAKIADLETEVSDLETIAEAVETHCRPRDGEEAYGWLMAEAVKALREERDRLLNMVARSGLVEAYAQCPVCFAERTNGERHQDDCALIAAQAEPAAGGRS